MTYEFLIYLIFAAILAYFFGYFPSYHFVRISANRLRDFYICLSLGGVLSLMSLSMPVRNPLLALSVGVCIGGLLGLVAKKPDDKEFYFLTDSTAVAVIQSLLQESETIEASVFGLSTVKSRKQYVAVGLTNRRLIICLFHSGRTFVWHETVEFSLTEVQSVLTQNSWLARRLTIDTANESFAVTVPVGKAKHFAERWATLVKSPPESAMPLPG